MDRPSVAGKPSSSIFRYYKRNIQPLILDFLPIWLSERVLARTICYPLPESAYFIKKNPDVYELVSDIWKQTLSNLHALQKVSIFWLDKAKAKGISPTNNTSYTTFKEVYSRLFETKPQTCGGDNGSKLDCHDSQKRMDAEIMERIIVLSTIRLPLATFLSRLYLEVDGFKKQFHPVREKSFASLLVNLNGYFLELEASIGCMSIGSLLFDRLSDKNEDPGSQWTDYDINNAINLLYSNLNKLDVFVSLVVAKYRKPRKIPQQWRHYAVGAIAASVFSVFLLRHSRLAGSINNWAFEAKESVVGFLTDLVEQPLTAKRDELVKFGNRHKGVMELKQVQPTSDMLNRLLLDFRERTKMPANVSDQDVLEMATHSYENQVRHPVRNFIIGDLARLMMIEMLKMKLDIEMAKPELNYEMFKANDCAILAASVAFFLSINVLLRPGGWLNQDSRAKGKEGVARTQLLMEVEKRIMQQQFLCLSPSDKHAINGLLLYTLNRLYRAVQRHAKQNGEWRSLREDLVFLGDPNALTSDKVRSLSRLNETYDCLRLSKHHLLTQCSASKGVYCSKSLAGLVQRKMELRRGKGIENIINSTFCC